MNTTITLLRLQIRLLRWPILTLVGLLFARLLLTQTGKLDLGDSKLATAVTVGVWSWFIALLASLAAWVASAWIFGAEYIEGAKDFLRTRPVSERLVFWCKISVLIPFVVGCAILVSVCTEPSFVALIIIFFLNASFSIIAMTILFRDTVRGMLTGLPAGAFIVLVLLGPWRFFFGRPVKWVWYSDELIPLIPFQFLVPAFLLGMVLLSPLVFLWVASWTHSYRWKGLLKPPFRSCTLLVIPLAYVLIAALCQWNEGMAVTATEKDSLSPIKHFVVDNRMYVISWEPGRKEYLLHVIDGRDPNPLPKLLSAFGAEAVQEAKENHLTLETGRPRYRIYVDDSTVALLSLDKLSNYIYRYAEAGITASQQLPGKFEFFHLARLPNGKIRLVGFNPSNNILSADTGDWLQYRDINLESGEISAASAPVKVTIHSYCPVFYTGTRWYAVGGEGLLKSLGYTGFDYLIPIWIGDVKEERAVYGSPPTLVVRTAAADGSLIAALYMKEITGASESQSIPKWIDTIQICDTTDLTQLKYYTIPLPFRLCEPYRYLDNIFETIGLGNSRIFLCPPCHLTMNQTSMTLGGGFLCLWIHNLGRVAVWDVRNLKEIHFLGISRFPTEWPFQDHSFLMSGFDGEPNTPLLRNDGALGFHLDGYGLVWLEFSALMNTK